MGWNETKNVGLGVLGMKKSPIKTLTLYDGLVFFYIPSAEIMFHSA